MLTNNGEVYVSNSHGEKWANMTQVLYKQFDQRLEPKIIFIQTMQVSSADPETVFLFGSNGQSFIAQKCGKQVGMITHDSKFQDFKLNRLNKNYILAHKPSVCQKFDDECDPEEKSLFSTKDMGRNWKKIIDNIQIGTWDKSIHLDEVPDYRILVNKRVYVQGKNNDKNLLVYSDDFFGSMSQIEQKVVHFYQTPNYLFILTESDIKESFNLKISPRFPGQLYDYKTSDLNLPIKRNKDNSFTILDNIQGSLFIGINHKGEDSLITNIYASDFMGQNYTLSLVNAVKDEEGNVDFEKIESNQGTFISNIYDQSELTRIQSYQHKSKAQFKDNLYSRYMGQSTEPKKIIEQNQFSSLENIKKTVISYNAGSSWHSLNSPKKDSQGKEINCSGECSLHLSGRTQIIGSSIFSSESAQGLILANGNIGVYLETKEENMNTYLSNDGGHTWKEIRKAPHIFSIADRGGLIVISRSNKETNQIHYSWDQGNNWKSLKISENPVEVLEIVTEHSNTSQKFLIFAKKLSSQNNYEEGIVISVDFTTLHKRECVGYDNVENPDSDYEKWIPKNYFMEECNFGEKKQIIRRKSTSKCYNPISKIEYIKSITCECTEEDYMCAFGFQRNPENNNCVPMNDKFTIISPDQFKSPIPCKEFYTIPTGYKRIPITKCQGGVDLGPIIKQCPLNQVKKTTKSIIIDEETQNNTFNQINQQQQDTTSSYISQFGYPSLLNSQYASQKKKQNKQYFNNFESEDLGIIENNYDEEQL